MLLLAQTVLYFAALGGVVAGSLGAIFFAGGAMNPARPAATRHRRWMLTVLCLCGIVASAALGFIAIPALVYFAQQ